MDSSPENHNHQHQVQRLNPNTNQSENETTSEKNLNNTGRRQPPRALQRLRDLFMQMAGKISPSQKSFFGKRFDDYFADLHIPDHPPYAEMILRAIREIKEQGGSNEESISNFIRKEYPDLPKSHGLMLKRWLRKLCENGEIVVTDFNRYLLGYSNLINTPTPSPSSTPSSSPTSSESTSSLSRKTKQRKMKGKRQSRRGRRNDDVNQSLNPNTNQSENETANTSASEKNLNHTVRRQPPRALPRFRDMFLKMSEKLTPSQKSSFRKRFDDYFADHHIPDHPPYAAMIQRAIKTINEKGGSSEESISNFIIKEYLDLPKTHVLMLKRWLGKLCETGEIVVTRYNRYLLGCSNSTDTPTPSPWPSSTYSPSSSPNSSGSSSSGPKINQWKMKGKQVSRRGRQNYDVDQEKPPRFEQVNITQALENRGHGGPQLPGGRVRGWGGGRSTTMMTPENTVSSERRGRGRPRKSKLSTDQNVGTGSQMQEERGRGRRGRPKKLDF